MGANVSLTTSNTVVLGNGANVGIGTSAPSSTLEVAGSQALPFVSTGAATSFTLTAAHHTVRRFADCTTLVVPAPATCPGRLYTLISSNGPTTNVGLTVTDGSNIYDDVTNATVTFLAPNARISIQSDGSTWLLAGR